MLINSCARRICRKCPGKKAAAMHVRRATIRVKKWGGVLQILGFPRDFAKLALSFRKKAHPIFLSGEYLHLIRMT